MSAESFLSSAIEIGVALAGFAGIVAAIRHHDVARWDLRDRILLRMLFTASGMAITFALLPSILFEAQVPDTAVWRVGSASLLVWQAAIGVHRWRQFQTAGLEYRIPGVLHGWTTTALVLQAINLYLAVAWPYLLGVFAVLLNAFTFFLILLFGGTKDEDPAAWTGHSSTRLREGTGPLPGWPLGPFVPTVHRWSDPPIRLGRTTRTIRRRDT